MVNKIIENISKVIVGKEDVCKLLLTSMVAGGPVLAQNIKFNEYFDDGTLRINFYGGRGPCFN